MNNKSENVNDIGVLLLSLPSANVQHECFNVDHSYTSPTEKNKIRENKGNPCTKPNSLLNLLPASTPSAPFAVLVPSLSLRAIVWKVSLPLW